MNPEVWRFELTGAYNEPVMPEGARVLAVGWSRGGIQLWAQVDPARPAAVTPRGFVVVGTGFDVPDAGEYVGSVVAGDGFHVVHVYEVAA